MKIKKIGHCCLRIEHKNTVILTDPGSWTSAQNEETGIDFVFITHEHQDHLHTESLRIILTKNPSAQVVCNSAVGKMLAGEGIKFHLLEQGLCGCIAAFPVKAFSQEHAPIYPDIVPVLNTGFLIDSLFFYPGDAFIDPQSPFEVLALPVCGPWLHISQAIDFAKKLKPKKVFPVHDGMLKITGPFYALPEMFLKPQGIEFIPLGVNSEINIS